MNFLIVLLLGQEDAFGDKGFWAPQVFSYDGRFYMAYTANEKMSLATSDNPLGPFLCKIKEPTENRRETNRSVCIFG